MCGWNGPRDLNYIPPVHDETWRRTGTQRKNRQTRNAPIAIFLDSYDLGLFFFLSLTCRFQFWPIPVSFLFCAITDGIHKHICNIFYTWKVTYFNCTDYKIHLHITFSTKLKNCSRSYSLWKAFMQCILVYPGRFLWKVKMEGVSVCRRWHEQNGMFFE